MQAAQGGGAATQVHEFASTGMEVLRVLGLAGGAIAAGTTIEVASRRKRGSREESASEDPPTP